MISENNDFLISCDWGTTKFRLFLVKKKYGEVLGKFQSNDGIAKMDETFRALGNRDKLSFFRTFLAERIKELFNKVACSSKGIPIVASGMVSSTLGVVEVAYTNLPLRVTSPNLNFEYFEATSNFLNPLYVIGGIKAELDVIRGEEIQLIGLQNQFCYEDVVCLLPGTHSKHIFLKNQEVVHFKTFMSGEIFQLLSEHGILRNSTKKTSILEYKESFIRGVTSAKSYGLFSKLFSIRAKTLLKSVSPEENYAFLSGLILGEELKSISTNENQIILASTEPLSSLYTLALKTLGHGHKLDVVSYETVENAVPRAHSILYQQLNSKE